MRKLSFFYKLLFSFIAIGIIPLLLVGLIAYGLLTNTIMDTVSRQAYNSVVKISENIDILTSEYGEIIVSLLSEDERLREALAGKITEDYPVIRQKIAVLAGKRNTALYILNPKGTVVFATHPLPRFYDPVLYRNQGLFQQADALKNGYIIYPHHYVNSIGDNVVYSIARTIRDERDRPIGYIIVEIFKSHIEDIANNINANLNLDLLVVDSNFFTVANLRSPKLDGKTFHFSQNRKLTAMGTGFFLARVAGKQSLIAFHTSKYTRFVTIGILPVKVLLESSNFIRFITLLACLLSSVVCLILAVLISRNISRPIYDLVESMKQVESGNLHARVNFQRRDELGLLGRSFNAMVGRIQDLVDNVVAKQRQLRNSEIKALQAQINPHFLYNTLDSIKWLAKLNHVPQISVIATQLGKLLRSSINDADLTTVEESIVTIQSYLAIQKIRYRDKFATVVEIEPNILHCRIPKLILQPIVENAIVHGFEGKKSQGCLSIRGWSEQSDLIFEVADNGVGMKPEWVAAINAGQNIQSASADAHSIGIQNVNRRIQLYYGPEYRLTVQSLLDRGTKVTLRMPIQPETEISKQFAPEDAK